MDIAHSANVLLNDNHSTTTPTITSVILPTSDILLQSPQPGLVPHHIAQSMILEESQKLKSIPVSDINHTDDHSTTTINIPVLTMNDDHIITQHTNFIASISNPSISCQTFVCILFRLTGPTQPFTNLLCQSERSGFKLYLELSAPSTPSEVASLIFSATQCHAHVKIAAGPRQTHIDECSREDERIDGPYFNGSISLPIAPDAGSTIDSLEIHSHLLQNTVQVLQLTLQSATSLQQQQLQLLEQQQQFFQQVQHHNLFNNIPNFSQRHEKHKFKRDINDSDSDDPSDESKPRHRSHSSKTYDTQQNQLVSLKHTSSMSSATTPINSIISMNGSKPHSALHNGFTVTIKSPSISINELKDRLRAKVSDHKRLRGVAYQYNRDGSNEITARLYVETAPTIVDVQGVYQLIFEQTGEKPTTTEKVDVANRREIIESFLSPENRVEGPIFKPSRFQPDGEAINQRAGGRITREEKGKFDKTEKIKLHKSVHDTDHDVSDDSDDESGDHHAFVVVIKSPNISGEAFSQLFNRRIRGSHKIHGMAYQLDNGGSSNVQRFTLFIETNGRITDPALLKDYLLEVTGYTAKVKAVDLSKRAEIVARCTNPDSRIEGPFFKPTTYNEEVHGKSVSKRTQKTKQLRDEEKKPRTEEKKEKENVQKKHPRASTNFGRNRTESNPTINAFTAIIPIPNTDDTERRRIRRVLQSKVSPHGARIRGMAMQYEKSGGDWLISAYFETARSVDKTSVAKELIQDFIGYTASNIRKVDISDGQAHMRSATQQSRRRDDSLCYIPMSFEHDAGQGDDDDHEDEDQDDYVEEEDEVSDVESEEEKLAHKHKKSHSQTEDITSPIDQYNGFILTIDDPPEDGDDLSRVLNHRVRGPHKLFSIVFQLDSGESGRPHFTMYVQTKLSDPEAVSEHVNTITGYPVSSISTVNEIDLNTFIKTTVLNKVTRKNGPWWKPAHFKQELSGAPVLSRNDRRRLRAAESSFGISNASKNSMRNDSSDDVTESDDNENDSD